MNFIRFLVRLHLNYGIQFQCPYYRKKKDSPDNKEMNGSVKISVHKTRKVTLDDREKFVPTENSVILKSMK